MRIFSHILIVSLFVLTACDPNSASTSEHQQEQWKKNPGFDYKEIESNEYEEDTEEGVWPNEGCQAGELTADFALNSSDCNNRDGNASNFEMYKRSRESSQSKNSSNIEIKLGWETSKENPDYDPDGSSWAEEIAEWFGSSDSSVDSGSSASERRSENEGNASAPSEIEVKQSDQPWYDNSPNDWKQQEHISSNLKTVTLEDDEIKSRQESINRRSKSVAKAFNTDDKLKASRAGLAKIKNEFVKKYDQRYPEAVSSQNTEPNFDGQLKSGIAGHNKRVARALGSGRPGEFHDETAFLSSPHSSGGKKLRREASRAVLAKAKIKRLNNPTPFQRVYPGVIRVLLSIADEKYADGSNEEGNAVIAMAEAATDIVLGIIPGLGWGKDIAESILGFNIVTGEELSDLEYGMAVIGVATLGIGSKGKNLKHLKALGTLSRSSKVKRGGALGKAVKTAESASDTIKSIGPNKFSEVIKIPKGSRPNPSEYLPKKYIDDHLSNFDNGASKFIRKKQFEKFGPAQADGTAFVLSKKQADDLISKSGGNKRALEKGLGFEPGFLDNNQLVRIDIPKPKSIGARVPSGNEPGTNPLWIPGGKLPNGSREAVVDLGSAPAGSWTSKILEF